MSYRPTTNKPHLSKYVTVFTDASLCPQTKIGAWACWAKIGTGAHSVKASGLFRGPTLCSGEAELKAIVNALHCLKKNFERGQIVVVQTDSETAIQHLMGTRPNKGWVKRLYDLAQEAQRCIPPGVTLRVKHVKAHTGGGDTRSTVNRFVDVECRRLMRDALAEAKRTGVNPFRGWEKKLRATAQERIDYE